MLPPNRAADLIIQAAGVKQSRLKTVDGSSTLRRSKLQTWWFTPLMYIELLQTWGNQSSKGILLWFGYRQEKTIWIMHKLFQYSLKKAHTFSLDLPYLQLTVTFFLLNISLGSHVCLSLNFLLSPSVSVTGRFLYPTPLHPLPHPAALPAKCLLLRRELHNAEFSIC